MVDDNNSVNVQANTEREFENAYYKENDRQDNYYNKEEKYQETIYQDGRNQIDGSRYYRNNRRSDSQVNYANNPQANNYNYQRGGNMNYQANYRQPYYNEGYGDYDRYDQRLNRRNNPNSYGYGPGYQNFQQPYYNQGFQQYRQYENDDYKSYYRDNDEEYNRYYREYDEDFYNRDYDDYYPHYRPGFGFHARGNYGPFCAPYYNRPGGFWQRWRNWWNPWGRATNRPMGYGPWSNPGMMTMNRPMNPGYWPSQDMMNRPVNPGYWPGQEMMNRPMGQMGEGFFRNWWNPGTIPNFLNSPRVNNFFRGVGLAATGLFLAPSLARAVRPLVVQTVQGVMSATDELKTIVSDAKEDIEDMFAEANWDRINFEDGQRGNKDA
ncbi:MAG: hypothetical protein ACOYVD_17630 [Bacillota bacterium]